MDAHEMLQEVQRLKSECVSAMISRNPKLRAIAEAEAKEFLTNNFAQILDIVDDALTAHLGGK